MSAPPFADTFNSWQHTAVPRGRFAKARDWLLASAAVTAAAFALSPAALATTGESVDTAQEIGAAVDAEPKAPEALESGLPGAPRNGANEVALPGGAELTMPAQGRGTTTDGATVYDAAGPGQAQVALQAVPGGARALINIDSPQAPERYKFAVSGDVTRLEKNEDGSVAAYSPEGELEGTFPTPWARDAAGTAVPTRYEVEDGKLVQYVSHRQGGVQYGVTADPLWIPLALAVRACVQVRCYYRFTSHPTVVWLSSQPADKVARWLIRAGGAAQGVRNWYCSQRRC